MTGEIKRLTPTSDTVRELYLKSGNECAFPGCTHRMINEEGVFIGEICHIEAALPGGERFNPSQSNEERRAFSNLMLMCHAHHKVTDNVEIYTVEYLKKMKAEHEAKFTNIIEHIRESIMDHTAKQDVSLPTTLQRYDKVLGWNMSSEDIAATLPELYEFINRLKRLPVSTRELLAIIVTRGEEQRLPGYSLRAHYDDVVEATQLDDDTVFKHMKILEAHKLANLYEHDRLMINVSGLASGWEIWADLRLFSERTGISLQDLVVNLRFDFLD